MNLNKNTIRSIAILVVLIAIGISTVYIVETYEPKMILSTSNYITVIGDTNYGIDELFNQPDSAIAIVIIIFSFLVGLIPMVCYILFWFFIIKTIVNAARRNSNHKYFKNNVVAQDNIVSKKKANLYVDVSKDKLAMFNTDDIDSLKKYLYDTFIKFETAYNNLDYNVMKMISTKQLYQNYYTGITLDLKVGKKRIIENIQKNNVIIYELDSTIAKQTICAMIEISYINYVLDRNGYVISGDRDNPITERFEVTFRKDFERNEITKCPNCGANITGNKCDYCRSIIKNVEFKISNIKKIID